MLPRARCLRGPDPVVVVTTAGGHGGLDPGQALGCRVGSVVEQRFRLGERGMQTVYGLGLGRRREMRLAGGMLCNMVHNLPALSAASADPGCGGDSPLG